MAKYVYPDTYKETMNIFFPDFLGLHSLKSVHPEGRIIANDNILEGL